MKTLVSRRYAKALFELLPGRTEQDAALSQLETLGDYASRSAPFREMIRNPAFTAAGRGEAVAAIAERLGVSSQTRGLLRLLARNNRLDLLEEIAQMFRRLVDERQGRVTVRLTVPEPVDETERLRLAQRMESITGRRISLELAVDPAILGGMLIESGGTIYDATLAGKLRTLRACLTEE